MAAEEEPFGFRDLQVRWQNFRGLKDTGWLDLKPITLLIGPNNGGKTSIHAPLLLLKQTLRSRTGLSALLLRGEILNMGAYPEVVHGHDARTPMTFGIRWHSHPTQEDLAPAGTYPPGEAEFEFLAGEGDREVRLRQYRARDTHRRTLLRRSLNKDGSYALRMVTPSGDSPPYAKLSRTEQRATTATRRAMKDALPIDFLFTGRPIARAGLREILPHDAPKFPVTMMDERVRLYCQITDYVDIEMRGLADDLYYLGPLRESPRRIYELSGEMPADVGTRGEYAPEMVYRWRNDDAQIESLRQRLRAFGVDTEITWRDRGDEAFSLYFTSAAGRETAFADLGFGMSQILPLIVQGMAAPANSWIVTEQPEIHLNPRFQAQLGDHFVSLIREGVGAIVETHSEHLLLRRRRLIAEGELAAEELGVLYVRATDSGSEIQPIPVSDLGEIDGRRWPNGFFGEAIRDSIGLAQAQLREL